MSEVALGWASIGMQALGTLGAATGAARMNRATIRGNKKAIALLDKNLEAGFQKVMPTNKRVMETSK